MVVDPPQHKSTINAETIASMERCSHCQGLAQGHDKGDTTQKNVQISRIGNAQPGIFIDPGPLKGIDREPASIRLQRIEQGGAVPARREKRRPIPFATEEFEQSFVDLNQALAFEKAKWVLQLQLQIATALPGVLAGHQTMHQGSQQGCAGAVTTGDKHLNDHFQGETSLSGANESLTVRPALARS